MAFTITIKKKIEHRKAIMTALPEKGWVRVQAFADGVRYMDYGFSNDEDVLSAARNRLEDGQLGGVVNWHKTGEGWESDTVLTDKDGNRIQGHELELARKALARLERRAS